MRLDLLKEWFAGFIRSHGMMRHFQRLALFESLWGLDLAREVPRDLAQRLKAAALDDPQALIARLGTHPDGLTASQAEDARTRFGPNEVAHEKPLPWWSRLWQSFKNPFNLLLTVLAVISYYTEDIKAATVISSMVVLSTLIRFVQELRSNRAADRLKEMVSSTATVSRRDPADAAAQEALRYFQTRLHPKAARRVEIPMRELVPGEVVMLAAGDMIPADLRLLTAKDLFVSQAAMTGESLPVEKFATHRGGEAATPFELDDIVFMGTNVISGSASAVVIATGTQTYFGALAQRATAVDRTATAFQAGVNRVSWLLIRFMLIMSPLVLLLNGFTKGDWVEAFLFALSVAVGLTPEMLPMIVTTTLAKGAVLLSRKKVIVKRLDAIQNFGAMDVLCTDKTGTLTQDRIALERHTDVMGADSDQVLQYAYLNSYYQTGLKNLLDVAVLEHAEVQRELDVARHFRKVDEIPFDFERRRMSVVVAERDDHHELICKGAVDEVLSVCSHVQQGDMVEPLTREQLERVRAVTTTLNEEGLRVVAVAVKELPPTKESYGVADESALMLVGYIAFLDPPKESTAPALAALAAHGVSVKVLTGDNELVTAKICRQVGLTVGQPMTGAQVEALSQAELEKAVETNTVFARLTPNHKDRIVRALRANGHVVGFLGDGINDAPALRSADIGISVDSAVDIAKEAADIILLEKNLMVLEEGVLEGRRTFVNMLKYIKMTASSNFGNVFSVLVAGVFLPFLPMLPLQLLVQNLLYDISQIAIPFDHVDPEQVARPQRWRPEEIGRFMVFFGPISSIFDVATFALMWFVFHASDASTQSLFQSGWFVEGLLSQTLIVHLIRTRRVPFLQSRAAAPLIGMTAAIVAVGIFLPQGPLAHAFRLQSLPLPYFAWLLLVLVGYLVLTQLMKGWYARRFGWQ